MAVLLVDLGNSRLKWSWFEEKNQGLRLYSAPHRGSVLEIDRLLKEHWLSAPIPSDVWVVSVATAPLYLKIGEWVQQHWSVKPQRMTTQAQTATVVCGYRDYKQLGADRWAALLAADHLMPTGGCVVDVGTACTIDGINGAGRHLGGFIVPNAQVMQQAVLQHTAVEPVQENNIYRQDWGDSTKACLELGSYRSIAALIEFSVERLQEQGVCDPGLILTGGGAESLAPFVQIPHHIKPELVLEGLVLYARENFI